jgi:hypothetical protein
MSECVRAQFERLNVKSNAAIIAALAATRSPENQLRRGI